MGLGWTIAAGAGGAGDALEKLIAQKRLAQMTAETNRHALVDEQQGQQRLDQTDRERRDALKEQQYQHGLQDETRRQTLAQGTRAQYAQGDVVSDPSLKILQAGGLGDEVIHQDPTLASTAYAGQSTLPGDASQPPTFNPKGTLITTQAGNPAQNVFRGTPQQRLITQQHDQLQKLISTLGPGREAEALQYEQATGKSAPAGMFEKADPIGDGNYMLDGKPIVAQKTKAGRIVYQGNDVTDRVQPFTPTPNPQPQIFKGPDGKDHAVKFVGDKATEIPLPDGFRKPNATLDNRVVAAGAVQKTGDDLIAQLSDPTVAAQLGPALGRYNNVKEFIGNPPPELSELAGEIDSYALANMGVHGMRSVEGAKMIQDLLTQKHTPASMIGAIRGLNKFSQNFMTSAGRTTPAAPAATTPKRVVYDVNGKPIQ